MPTCSEDTSGEFGGLGIEVTMEEGVIKVVSPIDDTPAAKAGILANDLIVELDGQQVLGHDARRGGRQDEGPVGTKIKLTVVREGVNDPIDFDLTRDIIAMRAVSWYAARAMSASCASPASPSRPMPASRRPSRTSSSRARRQGAQGPHPRSAQQSRRSGRPGGLRRRRLPRAGRRGADARPHAGQESARYDAKPDDLDAR